MEGVGLGELTMAKKKTAKKAEKVGKAPVTKGQEVAGKIIKAGDFASRMELENYVRNKYGLTTEPKEVRIYGTKQELRRLQLSHGSVFWGIGCECDEPVVKEKSVGRIPRGKRTAYGIEHRESPRPAPEA